VAGDLPKEMPIAIDTRVLLFTLGISVLTGIVFGIFPALQLSKTNVNQTLRDEGRGSTGGHGRVGIPGARAMARVLLAPLRIVPGVRTVAGLLEEGGVIRMQLRALLVVGQVALSLMLLIAAGLLMRSFWRLLHVNPGFDPQNVLTMNVSLPTVKYADAQKQVAFFDDLLRRVSTTPGVRQAAVSAALPLSFKRITPVLPEGQPEVPLPQRPFIDIEAISPQWFQTLHVPIKMGRAFTEADNTQAPKVLIVNETFARRFWPNENPIGKRIIMGRGPGPSEVVGLASDVKNKGLAQDPQAQIYFPFSQIPWGNMNLIVRTAADPHAMIKTLEAQIAAIDPDQPVTAVRTVDELMDVSRKAPQLMMLRLGIFSGIALVLVIVGIYGVLSYSVAQRRQELGIRLALGAAKADILRLIVSYGITLAGIGIAIGWVLAMAVSVIATSMFSDQVSAVLYKISVRDQITFVAAPVLFLLIALAASYLPARKATQVDPNEALRGA
jgi:predicted permease